MGLIGVASLLVAPLHRAFAPGNWKADLSAEPATGMGSKRIALSWGTVYPLPNGEGAAWYVAYTNDNGRTFDDITEVEFYFEEDDTDGGLGDDLDPACVEDPTTTIWKNGTNVHELMVFVPMTEVLEDNFRCFCTQDTAVDPEDSGFEAYPGMLTAILWNG